MGTQNLGNDAVQSPQLVDKVKESSSTELVMEVIDGVVDIVSNPNKYESEKAINVESESNIDEQGKDVTSLEDDIDIIEVDVGADHNNRHEVESIGFGEKEACSEIEIIETETAKDVESEEIKLYSENAASSSDNDGYVSNSAPVLSESILEGKVNDNDDAQSSNKSESLSVDSEVSPVTPIVRRVARKSTKPPQRPQRTYENINELLLLENLNNEAIPSPSPKRKLASPTSARKVARKSTRRPSNPQRTLFSEKAVEHEISQENKSRDVTSLDGDAALLQATPEKNLGYSLNEFEVLDEIVLC